MARGMILKARTVAVAEKPAQHAPAGQRASECAHAGEPALQLIHEDGLLAAIEITCACGKTTRFDCLYGGPDAAGVSGS